MSPVFNDDELFAIMVMCEASIPSCIYEEVVSVCNSIRDYLDPAGDVRHWLDAAIKGQRPKPPPNTKVNGVTDHVPDLEDVVPDLE